VVAPRPSLAPTPVGVAPQDNKKSALVVTAVAATVLLAGVIGQAAAAAASEASSPPKSPIDLQTQVGSGPTTEPAPEPVPVPGPTPDPSEAPSSSASPSMTKALGNAVPALHAGGLPTEVPTDGSTTAPSGGGGATTGGGTVDLGNGYGFQLPDGYEVQQQTDGFAMVFGDGGYFFALLSPPPADLSTMITDHLTGLAGLGIQDLQVSEPEAVQIPTSSVVACVSLGYQGVLADQQGGSVPVEGFAYYFQLQNGAGVTAFALYQQGSVTEGSPLIDGYNTMLNSLVSTF
jgi:hypothetical protein